MLSTSAAAVSATTAAASGLAASAAQTPDGVLLQYGAVGVLALVAVLVGRILLNRLLTSFEQTRTEFREQLAKEREATEKERTRGDRLERALQSLYETTQGANMDALRDTAVALSEALDVLEGRRTTRRPPTGGGSGR